MRKNRNRPESDEPLSEGRVDAARERAIFETCRLRRVNLSVNALHCHLS